MWRRDEEKQADRKRSSRGRVGKEERERGGRAKENKEGKMSDRKERGDRSSRSSRGRNSRWVDENTFFGFTISYCVLCYCTLRHGRTFNGICQLLHIKNIKLKLCAKRVLDVRE